jgi:uncharacterized protein YggE
MSPIAAPIASACRRRVLPSLLVLASLAGIAMPASADEHADLRVISVSGRGEVDAKPDMARMTLAVERRNPSMRAARDAAVRVSSDFLALTKKLGIPEKDVRTSGLTIQPEYRWPEGGAGQPTLTGYFVQRQLEVELRDLDKLGELIEGAVDIGVNQVSPPQLDSTRRRDIERDALAAAALDARANAARLAETLGVKLGPLRSLSAGGGAPPPMPLVKGMAMRAEAMQDAAASYTTGEIAFEATVTATFDLLAPSQN